MQGTGFLPAAPGISVGPRGFLSPVAGLKGQRIRLKFIILYFDFDLNNQALSGGTKNLITFTRNPKSRIDIINRFQAS